MQSKKLAVFVLYLIGLIGISLTAAVSYNQKSNEAVHNATKQLHSLVNFFDVYYDSQIKSDLPIKDCEKFLEQHSELLFTNRHLRSLSVTDNGTVLCSSVGRDKKYKLKVWFPSKSPTSVFYGAHSPFVKFDSDREAGVILIRQSYTEGYSVDFVVHLQYVFDLIDFYRDTPISISLKNATFSLDGKITKQINYPVPNGELFDIRPAGSFRSFWHHLVNGYLTLFIFWSLFILSVRRFIPQLSVFVRVRYWRILWSLRKSRFEPYIQPVFNADGSLAGAEVLARLIHPRKGLIPPSEFIDVAERNGLIKPITTQLLQKCSQHFKHANFDHLNSFRLGINACAIQFGDEILFNDVMRLQQDLINKPIELVVEITERHVFSDNEVYRTTIQHLKEHQVCIAIDDFGTGYCSLKLLLDIDVDIIKIDRSYVNTIDNGPNTALLENIINLSLLTKSSIVAEGIETQAQFDFLKQYGVKRYQGFLLEKPMPIEAFIEKYLS